MFFIQRVIYIFIVVIICLVPLDVFFFMIETISHDQTECKEERFIKENWVLLQISDAFIKSSELNTIKKNN